MKWGSGLCCFPLGDFLFDLELEWGEDAGKRVSKRAVTIAFFIGLPWGYLKWGDVCFLRAGRWQFPCWP